MRSLAALRARGGALPGPSGASTGTAYALARSHPFLASLPLGARCEALLVALRDAGEAHPAKARLLQMLGFLLVFAFLFWGLDSRAGG